MKVSEQFDFYTGGGRTQIFNSHTTEWKYPAVKRTHEAEYYQILIVDHFNVAAVKMELTLMTLYAAVASPVITHH